MSRREPAVIDDLRDGATWPAFQHLSAELGIGSVLAVPLLSRGRAWGVLDLYRVQPGVWTRAELDASQVLADLAVSYLVMAHARDEAKQAQVALAHRATHDALTGLPNRALLFDRLEHALSVVERRQSSIAVVFMDLDLFKGINDTYGHAAADSVLVEVARRLTATLREGDTLARFAGDEFVLVCEGLPQEAPALLSERVDGLMNRLRDSLLPSIHIGDADVTVTASMGVVVTADRRDSQELINDADTAMYAAKEAGRHRVHGHDYTALDAIGYATELEHQLIGALDRGELAVHYQPITRSGTHEVAAVEALLRWQQPRSGMLPAAAFVDIAVQSGLITDIGHWVLQETCRHMAEWRQEFGSKAPAIAFVNLSARELADPRLSGVVASAIATHGLEPGALGLEIVEHDMAEPGVVGRLHAFHQLGHPLAIDDFGTGYSSLSRLLDLPVQIVKLDKSFVAGLPDDERRSRFVAGVLLLASHLDADVVAEGIETPAQEAHLTRAGCQLLQGYHLAVPADPSALVASWREARNG